MHLLACAFALRLDCGRLAGWLDDSLPQARQEFPVSRHYRFEVTQAGGRYRIREGDLEIGVASDHGAAGEAVLARMHGLAMEALATYTKVHAGCAELKGRRVLVVGPGRSGKTTLMTRLLYEGFEVQGDEMVLLRDGVAVSYPRRFGIRQPTLTLVPPTEALAPEGARSPNSHGYQVFALDPSRAGFPWRIAPGPVDVVVFLDARRGEPSHLSPCPQHLMVQQVMSQSTAPSRGKPQWIRDVSDLVGRARCYTLAFGELDSAVAALRRVLAHPESRMPA